ncbi:unnamed protein product [Penicillium salamii]|uniref:DUF7702 domain-containing protein n=1 Tax=Penicillium salamii TaxID=1612424 RepID=A0A9W4IZL6_9EURO|nr:unnamed protein product [Penicillium salamii]
MMSFDYRHGISLMELVVYIPTSLLAVYVAHKHGYRKSSGWVYFVIFSLVRVVGSCCHLATLADPNSTNLYVAYAICIAIGLSPLIVSCVGLLSRANQSIIRQSSKPVNRRLFSTVSVASLVAVVLSIIGQVKGFQAGEQNSTQLLSKIGVIIFLAAWVGLAFSLFLIALRVRQISSGERRLVAAVGLSTLLLLIRVIYSVLSVLSNNTDFNMVAGNPTIMLVMAVLEEITICVICLGTGLNLPKQERIDTIEDYVVVG